MQINPSDFDPRRIYNLLSSVIVPRPIAWVSTVSRDGVRNLAPFSYFNAVTATPPLLSIAIARRHGRRKDTVHNASTTGELVVNLVTERQLANMVQTATDLPPEEDEITLAGLTAIDSVEVAPPRVAEALVQLECRTREILEVSPGIVDLLIAEVVLCHLDESLPVDERLHVKSEALQPVSRLGGDAYATLGNILHVAPPRKRT